MGQLEDELSLLFLIKLFFKYLFIMTMLKWVTLSFHSGIHNIECVYYIVPCLKNNFLAYLFHSDDWDTNKIKNRNIYNVLVKKLIDLQANGNSINLNFKNYLIYFALRLVMEDN